MEGGRLGLWWCGVVVVRRDATGKRARQNSSARSHGDVRSCSEQENSCQKAIGSERERVEAVSVVWTGE
jgi:hypothetical protein